MLCFQPQLMSVLWGQATAMHRQTALTLSMVLNVSVVVATQEME